MVLARAGHDSSVTLHSTLSYGAGDEDGAIVVVGLDEGAMVGLEPSGVDSPE